MCYTDDMVRSLQILLNESAPGHVFNCFPNGNINSLKGDTDYESLHQDLKKFYEEQYSSDRMYLVIQTKTSDNFKSIRSSVEEYFSRIKNKKHGK